jgi:hypothetical protein
LKPGISGPPDSNRRSRSFRNELSWRDERYKEETKSYRDALVEMQKKMEEFPTNGCNNEFDGTHL